MKGYKHVKFSRRTAKQNPQMILDAYDKLISKTKEALQDFNKKIHVITFDFFDSDSRYLMERIMNPDVHDHPNHERIKISVSSKEIIKIYDTIKKRESYLIELDKEFNEMKKERDLFNHRYIYIDSWTN